MGGRVSGTGGAGADQRSVRNFLVDASIQLRLASQMAVVATAIGLSVGLVLWNAWQATERLLDMGEAVPADGAWMAITGGERGRILGLGIGLAVALVGLFLVAVILSHRVAGPAVALAATCRRVGAGDLSTPRPLRRKDMLVDLAEEVSLMVGELRERELEERALLAEAAVRIRRSGNLPGGHEIAARLEELASRKGERLGPPA
jgi:hypothetical protein